MLMAPYLFLSFSNRTLSSLENQVKRIQVHALDRSSFHCKLPTFFVKIVIILLLIMYMKKLLHSDGLRENLMQFSGNKAEKR